MSPKFREFLSSATSSPHVEAHAQQAEAARYALIRRLSPSLRHHLVRYLQPIGMIYGVMDHRLSTPDPNLRNLHQDAANINKFAKAALAQCTDISSWLAPEEDTLVPVGQGVQECVSLLAGNLNFRGYQVINEVGDADFCLRRDSLRCVLAAALLVVTDQLDEPAVLTLSNSVETDHLTLQIQVSKSTRLHGEIYNDGYRKLTWTDVQAIAAVEDVALAVTVNGVTMSFAIEPANPARKLPSYPTH